jgi:hypothetical protein
MRWRACRGPTIRPEPSRVRLDNEDKSATRRSRADKDVRPTTSLIAGRTDKASMDDYQLPNISGLDCDALAYPGRF